MEAVVESEGSLVKEKTVARLRGTWGSDRSLNLFHNIQESSGHGELRPRLLGVLLLQPTVPQCKADDVQKFKWFTAKPSLAFVYS